MVVRRVIVLGTSAMSILLGNLYSFRAFGPTEAEVVLWGRVCLLAGVLALTAGVPRSHPPMLRLPGVIGFGILAAAQLPPILMWFMFHGMSISDGIPPSPFKAHWAWALPHALLLLGAVSSAVAFWRNTQVSA